MKAILLSDEVNVFHWGMLKSVLFILGLLPVSSGLINLWQSTEGSAQIMVGFFAITMMSSFFILSFYSALKSTTRVFADSDLSPTALWWIKLYRQMPMLFLASMVSYIATQL